MLATAGSLIFVAGTHANTQGEPYEMDDLMAAASVCARLSEQVLDGTYDVDFEETAMAMAEYGEGGIKIRFVKGKRGDNK